MKINEFNHKIRNLFNGGFLRVKSAFLKSGEFFKTLKPPVRYSLSGASAAFLLFFFYFIFFNGSYSLNKNVNSVYQVIPENVSVYIEIRNTVRLEELFIESATGGNILKNSQWHNFFLSTEFNDLISVFRIIELKTGISVTPAEIPEYFPGSAGVALMSDGSKLFVAETNLKSKAGSALLEVFKADSIDIEPSDAEETPPPENTENSQNQEGPQTAPQEYPLLYQSDRVELSNLKVNRIQSGSNRFFYFVTLENYLFISDSLDTLRLSVSEATKGDGGFLGGYPSGKTITDDYNKNDSIALVAFDCGNSIAAPLLRPFHKGRYGIFVVHAEKDKYISAALFDPEFKAVGTSSEIKHGVNEKHLPVNFVAALISNGSSASEVLHQLSSLKEGYWKDTGEGIEDYLKAANIDPDRMLSSEGFSLNYHGMKSEDKKVIPEFSFFHPAANQGDALLLSVFSHKLKKTKNHQGQNYFTYASSGEKTYYTPSSVHMNQIQYFSSDEGILQNFISAEKGNAPVLSDKEFFNEKEMGEYPAHLVIDFKKARENILQFYNYGAENSEEYSSATIQNDVAGLFSPFADITYLHLAFGRTDKAQTGSFQITGK